MIKTVVIFLMLVGVAFAGLVEDGIAEARKGNNTEALKLFEKSCNDTEIARGCYYAAQAYGKGTVVKKDTDKSFKYYQESCDLGYSDACMVVGSAYYYGYGAKQDYIKAEKLLGQACKTGDANGCFLVGSMYDLGQGVARDTTKALEFYKKACNYGSKKGCEYQKQMAK